MEIKGKYGGLHINELDSLTSLESESLELDATIEMKLPHKSTAKLNQDNFNEPVSKFHDTAENSITRDIDFESLDKDMNLEFVNDGINYNDLDD